MSEQQQFYATPPPREDFNLSNNSVILSIFGERGIISNNNSTLLKTILGGSLSLALLNEIYYWRRKKRQEEENEESEMNMIFERKNVEKSIDMMRRDVIRFISCNGVVMSGLAVCSYDYGNVLEKGGTLLKILYFLTSVYSPSVIAGILDRIGHTSDYSLYEEDNSTVLPLLKTKQEGVNGFVSRFYNFLKTLFIEPSFPRLLLLTSTTPFISILIGNRLIPHVTYSSTSNLLLEGYKKQLQDLQDLNISPLGHQCMIQELEQKKYASLFLNSYFLSLAHGLSANALYYWGEERGWRDFLWNRLVKIEKLKKREDSINVSEFFKNSLLVGFIAGLWNVPLTLAGINYGKLNSRLGVIPMILSHTLLSPLLCFVSQKIKNETNTARDYGVVASFTRGVFEAVSGLSQYLSDISGLDRTYGNLLVGSNSLSSCATLAILNIGLLVALSSSNRFSCTSKK